ncbi:MAG: hypothetical protein SGI98_11570 [Verrucomicrobiota bacterium]|nr:hypothetical protein [Verrucomicrobiota bacterium]
MKHVSLFFSLLFLVSTLYGNVPEVKDSQIAGAVQDSPVADLEAAIKLHNEGVKGDKKSVLQAEADFEKMHAQYPDNMLVMVYLGSIYTLRSRDIGFGPKALDYLKKGGKTMDAAVDKVPEDVHVRLVRAINYWNLPFFCGKKSESESDFLKLAELIEKAPDHFDREMRQYIYYYAGLIYKDKNDLQKAVKLWGQAIPLQPASSVALLMKREMQNVREDIGATPVSSKR